MFRNNQNISDIEKEISNKKQQIRSLDYRINNLAKKSTFENVEISFDGITVSLTGKTKKRFPFISHQTRDEEGVVTLHYELGYPKTVIKIEEDYSTFCEELRKIMKIAKKREEEKLEELREELKKKVRSI